MRTIYNSLHNLDLNTEEPINKTITEDFGLYMESCIKFATTDNPSSREYALLDNNQTVVDCIKKLFSLYQQGYIRPAKEDEDEVLATFTKIAKKLLNTEKLVQDRVVNLTTVQKGSIVQALIEDNGEYKYVVAKVEQSEWFNGETLRKSLGFPSENRKVWKSAVFDIETVDNDVIFKSIKAYVNNSAVYWTKEFLEVKEINSDTKNTKAALNAVLNVLSSIKNDSPQDYYNLRNSVIRELQTNQMINYSEMVSRLLDNYNPAGVDVNVTELKDKLLLQSKGKFDTQFQTNPDAIKKNKKIVLRVSPSIDIVVKEGLYDWESNFKICKKSDGASYLMVRCDEPEILKSFSVDE